MYSIEKFRKIQLEIADSKEEEFTISSWCPCWPEGGTWSKKYVLGVLDEIINVLEVYEDPIEAYRKTRKLMDQYWGLIHEVHKIAKKEGK